MSKFEMIKKLGLYLGTRGPYVYVNADDLEAILQSAQVVYGVSNGYGVEFSKDKTLRDTHQALLLCLEPIKKKTKAEAALELLQEMLDDCLPMQGSEHDFAIEAKRILEMKDEV